MRVIKMCLSLFYTRCKITLYLNNMVPSIMLDCCVSLANYFFGLSSYLQENTDYIRYVE